MKENEKLKFITHVALYCTDVERSKTWYTQVLEMKVIAESKGRFAALSFGEKHHDIALAKAPNESDKPTFGNVGLYHISIDTGGYERSLELYQRAKELDSEFVKVVDHRVGKGVYVRDPDGNVLEFWSESLPSYEAAINAIETFDPSFEENPVGYYLNIDEEVDKHLRRGNG